LHPQPQKASSNIIIGLTDAGKIFPRFILDATGVLRDY
jgi:hypothetical protein